MKYIVLIAIITNIIYGYNSKEINNFYNNYYSSKYDINLLKANESQTYKNIYYLITSKSMPSDKEKYNYLKKAIDGNKDYSASKDIDYLISISELMNYIIYYSSLPDKISYGKKSKEIYQNILKIDSSNFFALLGTAIGYMHAPAIAGGSDKKAFEYFNRALNNSKEKYQKYLSYVWLSQYYFKIKDNENYQKYIDMSRSVYQDGILLKEAIDRNKSKKKPL